MTNFIKCVIFSISPLSLMPYLRPIIFIKTAQDEKQAEKQAEDDMYVKTFY